MFGLLTALFFVSRGYFNLFSQSVPFSKYLSGLLKHTGILAVKEEETGTVILTLQVNEQGGAVISSLNVLQTK